MKEIKVYNAIHQLKERGFKKDSVAKQLNINWCTVNRYWNMTVGVYLDFNEKLILMGLNSL